MVRGINGQIIFGDREDSVLACCWCSVGDSLFPDADVVVVIKLLNALLGAVFIHFGVKMLITKAETGKNDRIRSESKDKMKGT